MDIFRFPNFVNLSFKEKKAQKDVVWCAPELGQLKFNVNGMPKGNPSELTIGGVLRDFKEGCLYPFQRQLVLVM
ncbi:Uncharacterized protein TCM_036118 [Theobroma cacao]|uniref:Uncharacterized protein n=1 Tax=Theobroma cacao TaxID=3641 RepID=A0A061FR39_THECC|nr:Uncharacterized protein TCM_036118 [Theobroma cacao]